MVAASILLAAIVTVAVTYQAFIVPEQNRQNAFTHSQDTLYSLQQLYTEGTATIKLAYSGASFLSSSTFPGQLSYSPQTYLNIELANATEYVETQLLLNNQTGKLAIHGLSEATLDFANLTDNISASYNFTNNQHDTRVQINTQTIPLGYGQPWVMRINLNLTSSSEVASYNYSLFSGDSMHLSLFMSSYNLSSILPETSCIDYETNSSSCRLFIKYTAANNTDLYLSAGGAIMCKPASYPLSYAATPWGITAVEAGTSSTPVPIQIQWTQNTLILDLYNITWSNTGTVSGSGSVGVKFVECNSKTVSTTFNALSMNFTSKDYSLQNSIQQLQTILKSGAPSGTTISGEQGKNSYLLMITSQETVSLTVHNVNAVIT